jgi:hypothetical protein
MHNIVAVEVNEPVQRVQDNVPRLLLVERLPKIYSGKSDRRQRVQSRRSEWRRPTCHCFESAAAFTTFHRDLQAAQAPIRKRLRYNAAISRRTLTKSSFSRL